MNTQTIRKEVRLSQDILDVLEITANKKKWSLKKTMEEILIAHAQKLTKPKN